MYIHTYTYIHERMRAYIHIYVHTYSIHTYTHTYIHTKYADDTYLKIGSSNIHTTAEEFGNIQDWALKNNLQINANKTKEKNDHLQAKIQIGDLSPEPLIPGAERVTALVDLGVVISSRLTTGDHLDQLLSSCASSIFALRTSKSHCICPPLLHQVARATTVASLLTPH